MKRNAISTALFALVSVVALSGCDKDDDEDEDKGSAAFKVQLSSGTTLALAATSLTAKLGGVDLIADCAGDQPPGNCLELNKAPDPDIWVNGGCNGDIAQCTTSNTEFFELINPAAANAVLNSQGRSIEPGTFTKVRIYLLNNDAGNALQCNNAAVATRPQSPINVTLPSALTVADGESVTVTLNYSPAAVDCANEMTISAVFAGMSATVTKN